MTHLTFKNNDRMPAFGLGTWQSKPGEVGQAIKEAIKIGYRHFDCAAVYGNEAEIGAAFSEIFESGKVKREDLWITSKLWNDQHCLSDVRPALEKTLKDLQLEYLDLYLIHWPVVLKKNASFPFKAEAFIPLEEVPIEETWRGMEACLDAGLTRHIGVSNFSLKKIKSLLAVAKHPPEMNQVESHPLLQQNELFELCRNHLMHFTAYSPLGNPGLNSDNGTPNLFELDVIKKIAQSHGYTPAQILIAWAVQRGSAVIPKSVNPKRLQQNFDAATQLKLSAEEMEQIAALDQNFRFVSGSFWTPDGGPYTLENLWDE